MSGYKVEICGVNTAKLPLLSSKEKEELFEKTILILHRMLNFPLMPYQ